MSVGSAAGNAFSESPERGGIVEAFHISFVPAIIIDIDVVDAEGGGRASWYRILIEIPESYKMKTTKIMRQVRKKYH